MRPVSEENKALARSLYEEGLNARDFGPLRRVFRPDHVDHYGPAGPMHGVEALISLTETVLTGFPDLHVTVEEAIAEGDLVVLRLTVRGTHRGPFMGLEPTGVAATWVMRDSAGLMAQLRG